MYRGEGRWDESSNCKYVGSDIGGSGMVLGIGEGITSSIIDRLGPATLPSSNLSGAGVFLELLLPVGPGRELGERGPPTAEELVYARGRGTGLGSGRSSLWPGAESLNILDSCCSVVVATLVTLIAPARAPPSMLGVAMPAESEAGGSLKDGGGRFEGCG